MGKTQFLELQASEEAVFHAASRIFSAYINSHRVTDENEDFIMEKALDLARKLVAKTEAAIKSDSELG